MPPKTTWGPELYQDIAVAVWDVAELTRDQTDRIIQKLNSKGHTMTKEAVRQRMQKMIRAENAASGSKGGKGEPEAGSSTSRSSVTLRPTKGKGKRKADDSEEDDSEDDDYKKPKKSVKKRKEDSTDDEQKKPKKPIKKQARKVKKEEKDAKGASPEDNDEWSGREEARKAQLGHRDAEFVSSDYEDYHNEV